MSYKFEVLTAVDKKIHLSVLVTYPHLSILMIYPESPTCSRPYSSFLVNQSKAAHELARSEKAYMIVIVIFGWRIRLESNSLLLMHKLVVF